jgi:hypothetical protein
LSGIFTNFCEFFQREGPVIHLLAGKMSETVQLLLHRFLSPEHVNKPSKELMEAVEKHACHLPHGKLSIGTETIETIQNLDISSESRHAFISPLFVSLKRHRCTFYNNCQLTMMYCTTCNVCNQSNDPLTHQLI